MITIGCTLLRNNSSPAGHFSIYHSAEVGCYHTNRSICPRTSRPAFKCMQRRWGWGGGGERDGPLHSKRSVGDRPTSRKRVMILDDLVVGNHLKLDIEMMATQRGKSFSIIMQKQAQFGHMEECKLSGRAVQIQVLKERESNEDHEYCMYTDNINKNVNVHVWVLQ